MKLTGQAVKHNTFGKGVITDCTDTSVTVLFSDCEKKFLYPDAFSQYLTLKDIKLQEEVSDEYEEELKEEKEKKVKKAAKYKRLDKLRSINNSENSQAIFNVCDCDVNEIIEKGEIFTGYYISGEHKGHPKQAIRLKPNSACLITTLADGVSEKERRIKAIFMVSEAFYGTQCHDGIIKAHQKYIFKIPENIDIKLWDYIKIQNQIQKWGKTAFKYISSSDVKKIIYDIAIYLKGSDEYDFLKTFYKYFCLTNQFTEKTFPD